jgi:hypothetical protein
MFLYVYLPIVARQRLGKHSLSTEYTRNDIRIVKRVVVYAGHVVTREVGVYYCCPVLIKTEIFQQIEVTLPRYQIL